MPLASVSNTGPSNPDPNRSESALWQEQPSLVGGMFSTAAKTRARKQDQLKQPIPCLFTDGTSERDYLQDGTTCKDYLQDGTTHKTI
jgi:hypothetical protein